jgi:hypothetical protein
MNPDNSRETADSCAVATTFLQNEHAQARKSYRRTKLAAIVIGVIFLGYSIFLISFLHHALQPATAGDIAAGVIVPQIDPMADKITAETKSAVSQLNEQAQARMKDGIQSLRAGAEKQMLQHFDAYLAKNHDEIVRQITAFLNEHKDKVVSVLNTTGPVENARTKNEIVGAIDAIFEMPALPSLDGSEESSLNQLGARSSKSLHFFAQWLQRLADNKDLTPQEKRVRTAIAGILATERRPR